MRAAQRLSPGRARLLPLLALVLLALLPLLAPALASPASAAPGAPAASPRTANGGTPVVPDGRHPWFGPSLDIHSDTPDAYAHRLGAAPSLSTFPLDYPLTEAGTTQLRSFAQQVADEHAVLVLQPEPTVLLADLTDADAQALGDLVASLVRDDDLRVLVRFAPEMNGSWRTWGQQPTTYKTAFRAAADAVHAATDRAAMVWSPVYGSGYPFGRKYGTDSEINLSRQRETSVIDTNGDGRVDQRDDPYGPYYPGDRYVDWVGLFLYRFGQSQGVKANTLPPPGEVRQRLAETWGYGAPQRQGSFYDRFARGHDKPLLLETSALYNPNVGGVPELRLKRTWWREVFAAMPSHPLIRAVSWLELARREAEVDGQRVDWRATHRADLASALLADLRGAGFELHRLPRSTPQEVANEATKQGRLPPRSDLPDSMGWVLIDVLVLVGVFLLSGLVGRLRPGWRYTDTVGSSRDRRLDLFRGFLICTVVITHTELAGPLSYTDLDIVLAVTGAEGFVLLSGVVVGLVHRPETARLGEWAAAVRRWQRARTLYVTALVVVLLVYGLGRIPGVDATSVTTFTDRGTGAGGSAAAGRVYDLYTNAAHLFDYPPPWYAVKALLLLEIGPWVLNILGLFVVLLLVTPLVMALLLRRLWWVVLLVSWGLYVWGTVAAVHPLPSQFEDVFPLLIWQVAFVNGLVVGFHRDAVIRALTSRVGKAATTVVLLAYALALSLVFLAHRGVLPDGPLPPDVWSQLYDRFYVRVDLQPGRLLDMAVVSVVAFAFLTAWWKPVEAAVGRFLVPLGQASLYVFVMHTFLVVAVANLPGLDRTSAWQGTVIHVAELAVLWALVRSRFLFGLVPR